MLGAVALVVLGASGPWGEVGIGGTGSPSLGYCYAPTSTDGVYDGRGGSP